MQRIPKIILFGLLIGAVSIVALSLTYSHSASAQSDAGWVWAVSHTARDITEGCCEDDIVVIEGQIGEETIGNWNYYRFVDDSGSLTIDFEDEVPDAAIPAGVTVRIIGKAENNNGLKVDVYGLQVLEPSNVQPTHTVAEIASNCCKDDDVIVEGVIGALSNEHPEWNWHDFSAEGATVIANLEDGLSAEQIPSGYTLMLFAQGNDYFGDPELSVDLMYIAGDRDASAATAPVAEESTADVSSSGGTAALGDAVDLLTGVPEPADMKFMAEDVIHEGGRHFYFTSVNDSADIVSDYQNALESAGWTVEDSGGGGDPFGFFSGAGLTATNDSRYLKMHAGGPSGNIHVDICIWPTEPSDDDCGQPDQQQTDNGDAALGSSADLLASVPEPADAKFRAEDAIQESGRHFFYTTSDAPASATSDYSAALEAAGWTVESSGGGGDPFGLFGSGSGLTATNDERYLKFNAGGPPGSTFIDICVWPTQPDDDNCDQNNNQSDGNAFFGEAATLTSGIPEPANADFQAKNAIWEGGQHFWYTSSENPSQMVSKYGTALEAAGWRIDDIGGGGDPFGLFGGGAGLTATNADRYLKVHAGGPVGATYMDICVWPSEPSNNDCDQDAYAQTNGSATLGSVGELLDGVPELDGVEFKAEDSIQEGGRHFFFTSEYGPSSIVGAYERALENAGWKILSSGGDPFGLFGAGLSASDGTRYISLNAGGPAGSTFVDACIWPAQPSDTNCGQNQNARGNAQLGSGGSLLDNVPAPADATYQAQDSIQENGRHFYYTTTNAPADVAGAYQTALENNGWTIKNSGGGGDPFGLFASGAGLTATNGSRYLKLNAGGPIGSTHVDICVWPSQPVDDDCGQNNNRTNRVSNGNAPLGSSAGLLNGVPALSDAEFKSENPIQSSGRHFFFMSTTVPQDVVDTYSTALTNAGWTVESAGGGGDPFGLFGSGAGLTATDGTRVIKLNAGGPAGTTFINACIWPNVPANDNCGQNNN